MALATRTRRKCFISYHHADQGEVEQFIQQFDHDQNVFIARGIGASMPGDIINSADDDYIKSKIRASYLRDTTVTVVLVGRDTWRRKFVDWEVAASLRKTPTSLPSGLLAITLPSAAGYAGRQLPERVADNVDGEHGYARWWKYPESTLDLAQVIDTAYELRTSCADLRDNTRSLRSYNS